MVGGEGKGEREVERGMVMERGRGWGRNGERSGTEDWRAISAKER